MRRYWLVAVGLAGVIEFAGGQEPKKVDPVETYFRQFKEPEVAKELVVRYQSDQTARQEMIDFQVKHKLAGAVAPKGTDPKLVGGYAAVVEKVQAEDRKNLAWLKAAVAKYGWLGKSLVGPLGAQNAWLLVQHADADRDFQKACLEKMAALPKDDVDPQHLAYLTDRVLAGEGKKQKYGTQAAFKDGKVVAAPIEDEGTVDERRKAIGLGPLADYLQSVEKAYTVSAKADPGHAGTKK